MNMVKKLFYIIRKKFKVKQILYDVIKKTKSKQLSVLRARNIYDKEGARNLNEHDQLEIYDYHKKFFEERLEAGKDKTILDFGCGTGRYLEIQKNFRKVYLVDISKHNLLIASSNARELKIEHSVLKKSLFGIKTNIDIFFSVGVFGQTYPFDEKVANKIYSLLNENGYGLFTIKTIDEFNHEPHSLHKDEIEDMLRNFTFEIEIRNFKGVNEINESFCIVKIFKD